jgi:hypothetical protein
MGQSTGLGLQGIMQMGGEMATSGMLGEVRNPQEFLSKFREKLGQVREVSRTLDISLQEATAVMQQLQDAGISAEGQVGLSTRAGAISGLTGQSLDVVMGAGMEGVQMGAQLGISADRSFQVGMQNLSSMSVMAGLGAIDPRTLARYGGATGLAQQMTQIDLQMGMTHGGQEFISRLVNEQGSGFDFERMRTARGGDRPGSRRDIDPYAMADLQDEFLENQRGIVLGRIAQLRGEHTDDLDFNRAQYRFLQEMGIDDPQMQQAYLQNLRSAPTMDLLETGQQIESNEQMASEIRGRARDAFSRVFDDMGNWINEAISQPIQEFGRTMARTFEEAGQAISEMVSGRAEGPTGMIAPDVAALQEYGRGVWMGNFDQGFSRTEIARMMEGGGAFGTFEEADRRGILSRSGLFEGEDTRLAAWAIEQESQGRLDLAGMGIRTARFDPVRESMEGQGFSSLTEGMIDLGGGQEGYLMATGRQQFALRMARAGITVDPETLQVARPSQPYMELFESMMSSPMSEQLITEMQDDDGDLSPAQVLAQELNLPSDFQQTATGRATIQAMMQSELLPESIREERPYRTIQGGMAAVSAEYMTGLLTGGGASDIGEDRVRELLGSARGRRSIRMVSAAAEAQRMFGGRNFFSVEEDEQSEVAYERLRHVAELDEASRSGTSPLRQWEEEWNLGETPVIRTEEDLDRARQYLEAEGVRLGSQEDIIPDVGGQGGVASTVAAVPATVFQVTESLANDVDVESREASPGEMQAAGYRRIEIDVGNRQGTYWLPSRSTRRRGSVLENRSGAATALLQHGQEREMSPDEMAFMALAAGFDPTSEEDIELFRESVGSSESSEDRLRRQLLTAGRGGELRAHRSRQADIERVEQWMAEEGLTDEQLQMANSELYGLLVETRAANAADLARWEEEGLGGTSAAVTEETAQAMAESFERLDIPGADREQLVEYYNTLYRSEAGLSTEEMAQFAGMVEAAGMEVENLPAVMDYVTATQVEAVRAEQFAETADALRAEGADRLFQSDEFLSAAGREEFLRIREEQRERAIAQGRDPDSVTNADVMDQLMEKARSSGRMDGTSSYFESGASGAAELYMRLQGTGDVSAEGMEALNALVDRERRQRIQGLDPDLSPEERAAAMDQIENDIQRYRETLTEDWSNVSFADVMYGTGASIAEGGITGAEVDLLSLLPGSERVMGLQATMEGGADAEQLQTVLASMVGGGAERQQQFAESMGAESMEDLAARLQEEGVGGETFQELVGRAIAEGTLSEQSMEQFEERSMQQKRDQALLRMDDNLNSVIAGSGRRALVTVGHRDINELSEE